MTGEATFISTTYDPAHVSPGIAHFGVGNFHRSHQAIYIDRLISQGDHNKWGIVGIGVMPNDVAMRDALANQNYGYTLIEIDVEGNVFGREINSIRDFLFAPEDPAAVLQQLTDREIRIVSLTITEGGYNIDHTSGAFDIENPALQHDLRNPENPTTVFGYITEALRTRRDQGIPPFTVMSCDNLPANGDVARHAITAFAREIDPSLASWIDEHVAFPNSMVDRITPVTTDEDRALVKDMFGTDDAWPVRTEPYTHWVLEDTFSNGRPDFERVGVQLVDDVAPYELMKLRLLNGAHQAMAYIGTLLGHEYVYEAVGDENVELFLRAYLEEARMTLDPVPGIDVDQYIESLFERFRNPYIADTLARLAVDASDRIPKFVLPTIRDNLAANRQVTMGAAVIASWFRYLEVADAVGVEVIDAMAAELLPLTDDASAFLSNKDVFGTLADERYFAEEYLRLVSALQAGFPRKWLRRVTVA